MTSSHYDIQVRCPTCHRRICNRKIMHDEKTEAWVIEIRHRKMKILAPAPLVITCPSCQSTSYVNNNTGVEKCLKK